MVDPLNPKPEASSYDVEGGTPALPAVPNTVEQPKGNPLQDYCDTVQRETLRGAEEYQRQQEEARQERYRQSDEAAAADRRERDERMKRNGAVVDEFAKENLRRMGGSR